MNLVLLYQDDFSGKSTVRLSGRRLEHVAGVHRVAVGESLHVGLLGGNLGQGRITSLDAQAMEMEVHLETPPPPKLPLTLVVALPRPKAVNRVIIAATSLGAARLVFVNAWRVEKAYWGSPRLCEANLFHQRVLGLEQAKDTVLPEIVLARLFVPFVRDVLPAMAAEGARLLAHPGCPAPCPVGLDGPCTVVIGPEGGFVPQEIATLEEAGFSGVGLGHRVLRTETALAAIVGRLYS